MLTITTNTPFPITVGLVDEETGEMATGYAVSYDIRTFPDDVELSPNINGILIESSVTPGIYNGAATINTSGNYILYATCSGFTTNTENILVEDAEDFSTSDLSELIKQNRHYNISVEDVIRTTQTPTASQAARKVPKGRTDYIITKIKRDEDIDWSGDVVEGRTYAWYRRDTDQAPYRMGEEGI